MHTHASSCIHCQSLKRQRVWKINSSVMCECLSHTGYCVRRYTNLSYVDPHTDLSGMLYIRHYELHFTDERTESHTGNWFFPKLQLSDITLVLNLAYISESVYKFPGGLRGNHVVPVFSAFPSVQWEEGFLLVSKSGSWGGSRWDSGTISWLLPQWRAVPFYFAKY